MASDPLREEEATLTIRGRRRKELLHDSNVGEDASFLLARVGCSPCPVSDSGNCEDDPGTHRSSRIPRLPAHRQSYAIELSSESFHCGIFADYFAGLSTVQSDLRGD